MFKPNGNANESRADIHSHPFFFCELGMGGACRMGGNASGISEIGCAGEHFQVVHEFAPAFQPTL